MQRIYLKQGREKPILNGHPWVFSGAIQHADGDDSAVADVFDSRKNWLARGLFSANSPIRVRIMTWRQEAIDQPFFARRMGQANAARQSYFRDRTDAYRVINGEGDFLPGLVVDRYGDFLVCQFLTAEMDGCKEDIVAALGDTIAAAGIFERSEGRVRDADGIDASIGRLAGEEPPEMLKIEENGHSFYVDIRAGQKTGFFLDQRDNRGYLATLVKDRSVLNCFAYTGGFSVYAAAAGATEIVSFDSSRPALEIAEKNFALNELDSSRHELIKGDAFAFLKECHRQYDIIALDPPSLAHKRSDIDAATGGYKYLNLHAMKHLEPGGTLLTFSCSQHLSLDLFQKVVFGAAVDAKRKLTIVKRLGQPFDHPVSLHHPEGEYLKGLALRAMD